MQDSQHLRIKPYYSIIAHGADVVELRHGVWNPVSFTLSDDSGSGVLYRLLKRLDGSASPAVVAREEQVSRDEVEDLIDELDRLGVIESGPSSALDYYLDNLAPTIVGQSTPAPRPVRLLGDKALSAAIAEQLRGSEFPVEVTQVEADDPRAKVVADSDRSWLFDGHDMQERLLPFEGWSDSLVVLASTIINPLEFKALNRASLEYGFPWMHVALDGPFLLIGPTFVPRRHGCYECFETRVTMNLRQERAYQAYKNALVERELALGKLPLEPILINLVAAHAALEIGNYVAAGYDFTVGKCMSLFLPTMEFAFNEVLRVPNCPACSPVSERDDKELYFDLRTVIQDEAAGGE